MNRLRISLLVLAVACLAGGSAGRASVVASQASAGSRQATVLRVTVDGYAETFFGDCPFIVPPGPISCHETAVQVFKEGRSNSGLTAPPDIPWSIFIDDYTVTFTSGGPDAVPIFSDERTGFLSDLTSVTFDQPHLSFLTVNATVPMSDGNTFDFRGNWSRTSDRMLYGNNGPENGFEGLARHTLDRCATQNANAHQKFVLADMSGTLNGAPVHSYPGLGADVIAYNHFVYIDTLHGSC